MSQSIMESLFGDDPFFQDEYLLWPRRCNLAERFLRRREQMMESFVGDRLINDLFQSLDELFSQPSSSTLSSSSSSSTSSATARIAGPNVFCLDARGFSPDDIAVTVCGRKLEVKVAKPTGSDSSSPTGFSRSVELPEHINPSTLTCTLGDDGFLKIESTDVKQAEQDEQDVPVRYRTSLDFPLSKDNTGETEEKSD